MTFDDHITADHYRELLRLANPLNKTWILWGFTIIIVAVSLAMLGAMGLFFYAAILVLIKKGLAGVAGEPVTLALIAAGLVFTGIAVFVLAYKRNALRFFWKIKQEPDIGEMDLRDGLHLGPARYTLSDDGIRVEMALDTDELRWSAFTHFREAANGMLLMFNRTNGMVVPSGQLVAAGDYEAARRIVSAHVKRKG